MHCLPEALTGDRKGGASNNAKNGTSAARDFFPQGGGTSAARDSFSHRERGWWMEKSEI